LAESEMAKRALPHDAEDDYGVRKKVHKTDKDSASADDISQRLQQRYSQLL